MKVVSGLEILVASTLIVTLNAAIDLCSIEGAHTVLVVPASVCSNAVANVPICNAVAALRFCSNITVNGVEEDGESYLMNLASRGSADGSVQLVVMSRQVVHALAEFVFQSSTVIARAIVELTQQFGWSRITIVADTVDVYFLHTAEELYKMTSNLSSDSTLLQLEDSNSEIENFVNKVEKLNLRIIVLSLRPNLVSEILLRACERHLVWPEYAWIVHSVEASEERCGDNSIFNGVITIRLNDSYHAADFDECSNNRNQHLPVVDHQYLDSCSVSPAWQQGVVLQQIGKKASIGNETAGIVKSLPHPSDLPPQYVATAYIALFYTATTVCFIICIIMLVLFVCFRNEPSVKATSVPLSILIFVGCYLIIFYLYILNSSLLPSFHRQREELRNCMCAFRTSLNGVGFPIALILSTLLVKLLRVYRLFNLKRRVSRITTSNLALAAIVLLMTLPNVVVSLAWSVFDPYTSTVMFSIRNGFLYISVLCVSHSLRWPLLLFVYISIVSLLLIIFAVLTRKIKYRDFKDTKKISILSFLVVFTCATSLFYWYLFRIIRADVILIHSVLQIGHYCIILECQGFVFAPKLFPVMKERLMRRYYRALNIPTPKTTVTNTH